MRLVWWLCVPALLSFAGAQDDRAIEVELLSGGSFVEIEEEPEPPTPPPAPPAAAAPPVGSVSAQISLDRDLPPDIDSYKGTLQGDLAVALLVDRDRVVVTEVRAGSVVVEFYVKADESGTPMDPGVLVDGLANRQIGGGGVLSTQVTAAKTAPGESRMLKVDTTSALLVIGAGAACLLCTGLAAVAARWCGRRGSKHRFDPTYEDAPLS